MIDKQYLIFLKTYLKNQRTKKVPKLLILTVKNAGIRNKYIYQ